MHSLLYYWEYRPRPLRRLTAFIQRGRRGWAVEDTWSFSQYLAKVIAGGVEYLRDHNHGYQTREDHFCLQEAGRDKEYHQIVLPFTHDPCNCKEWWDEQLTLIANGFKEWAEDELGDTLEDELARQERLKETLKLFSEHFMGLWD